MTYQWRVFIEAWPHSTGAGADVDQAAAGVRVQTYTVRANDIRGALERALLIAEGMESNPAVWQAVITELAIDRDRASP